MKKWSNKPSAHAVIYIFGTILTNGIVLLTMPIFTRLLTVPDFGAVSLYTMWANILSSVVGLNISASLVNAAQDYKEARINKYISSAIILSAVSFLFFIGIGLTFQKQVSGVLNIQPVFILPLLMQSFASSCINTMLAKYRAMQQPIRFLVISVVNSFLAIATSLVLISFSEPSSYLYARIYGIAFPTILLGSIFFIFVVWHGRQVSIVDWKYCLKIALPLVLHTLCSQLLNHSDRYMLSAMSTEYAVGLYSFSYNIASLVSLLFTAMNNAWVPFYFRASNNVETEHILHYFKLYSNVFLLIVLGYLLVSPEFSLLIGSKKYVESNSITPLLILGNSFTFFYSFASNHEHMHKKMLLIALGTAFAGILNIGLNIVFIKYFGVFGAALATCIASYMLFIVHDLFVKFKLSTDYALPRKQLYMQSIILIFACAGHYLLMDYVLLRWSIAAIIGFLLLRTLYKRRYK